MKILVHASPTTLAPFRSPNLGVLCSPRRFYGRELEDWTWAADNDAFSKWDAGRYRAMLEAIRGREGCVFVTAPDVVGDYRVTMQLFAEWRDELADLPVAFVGQDDQERYGVPWDAFEAFFVGGTSSWKMGEGAARLVREAKDRGKHVHMGRVNSHRRLRYAKALGCDSIDGSGFSWFRGDGAPKRDRDRDRLRKFLEHAGAPTQELLVL